MTIKPNHCSVLRLHDDLGIMHLDAQEEASSDVHNHPAKITRRPRRSHGQGDAHPDARPEGLAAPVPEVIAKPPSDAGLLSLRIAKGIAPSLAALLGPLVRAWSPPHFEKMCFQYRIRSERLRQQARVDAEVIHNQGAVRRTLAERQTILSLVEQALEATHFDRTDLLLGADPLVDAIQRHLLARAGSEENFKIRGRLFSMGWGGIYRRNYPPGMVPAAPDLVAGVLLQGLTDAIETSVKNALAAGVICPRP